MRKTVGVLGVLFQAIGLVVVGGQPAAAATPIPVMTSPRGEFQPAVGDGVLAWEENTKARPNRFNVFVRAGNGGKTRVNARRTRGANGGIDGDLLVYQQYRGDSSSNIYFFDIPDARRSKPPGGVNTKRWEYWPSVSNGRLLFGRLNKGNGDRKAILYNLKSKNKKVLAKSTGRSRSLEPGQVNGDHVVWSKCTPSDKCDVFHHQISTGRTEKVPNPGNFQQAPSVAPDGTVYFVRSALLRCGPSVRLMRYADGEFEKLTQVPDGNDITDTYAHVTGAGINEVYYANSACASAYRSDIFKVVDRTGFTLNVVKGGSGQGSVTSTPGGIECGTTCSSVFSSDEQVTLSAQAVAGSLFAGWGGGGCSGTETCTVTMDRARNVTATFELTSSPPMLTVTKDGSGTGTVTSNPAGISCGSDCNETYPAGTTVTLAASPGANSDFGGWSGSGCTGIGTCTVTMDAAKTVQATFTPKFTLVVSKVGTGTGTVISSPSGINCGNDCDETYAPGTVVTLNAFPATDSIFSGWSGACTGTETTCTVTVDQTKAVTATFTSHLLTVTKLGNGTGTVTSSPPGIDCGPTCSKNYAPGSVVQLSAAPGPNSTFAAWSGACTGTGTCLVTMDVAKSVTATFDLVPRQLTVSITPSGTATVTGTVTSNPAGIICPDDCSEPYPHGTVVELTATPAEGSSFTGWSSEDVPPSCAGTVTTCTVTMDRARNVTATFFTVDLSPGAESVRRWQLYMPMWWFTWLPGL